MPTTSAEWGGWGPAVRDDPFPLFDLCRSACPVQEVRLADGHDAWLVLGHHEARMALKDRRLSKDMLAALQGDPDVVAEGLPGPGFSRHMLNVDPPDHTRLRKLVARAFVPARVAALEPAVTAIAGDLLDRLQPAGPGTVVDLVAGYARPLPFWVIGELLGVPAADRPALHTWFQTLLRPYAGDPPPDMVTASDSIVAYLADLVAAKSRTPGDDLVSALVSASDDDGLTRQELLSSLFQLIVAGHDTTTSLIGNSVVALVDHPDQMADLVAHPGLLPRAVEELLRYCAAVPHATFRVTTEDVDLGRAVIPGPAGVGLPRRRQPRYRPMGRPTEAGYPPSPQTASGLRPRYSLLPRRTPRPPRGPNRSSLAARSLPRAAPRRRPRRPDLGPRRRARPARPRFSPRNTRPASRKIRSIT
jgi:cytochrome P450